MRLAWAVLFLAGAASAQMVLPAIGSPAGASGGTTFTYVGGASNSTSSTTSAVTYSPTAGNLVIADIECRDGTAAQNPSLTTDNGTSTWANALTGGQQSGSYYNNEDYTLASAGTVTTITAHCGAATLNTIITVREYHRSSGTWVFGGTTTNAFGASTTATGNSVTPTASVPALISGYFMNTNNSTNTWTSSTTTVRQNQGAADASYEIGTGDQIVASASGSYAAVATISVSTNWQAWTSWYK